MIEKKKIVTLDFIHNKLNDKASSKIQGGFVQIIDKKTGEILVNNKEFTKLENVKGKDNLILYSGREIAAQRMFNVDRIDGTNEKDLFICWLGVGTGGADANDILNPIIPQTNDNGLVNEIVIDVDNPAYADNGKKKPFDSIEFLQDTENEDRWLLVKTETTLTENDANNNDINEACLYLSNSRDPIVANIFIPWARVTFSTIRKDQHREIIILWYVYF